MICEKCGKKNRKNSKKCNACGNLLNEKPVENNKLSSSIFKLIIIVPFFLIGLSYIGFSLLLIVSDIDKSKKFEPTDGKLSDYVECGSSGDSNKCYALYEFGVDDQKYFAKTSISRNKNSFKEKELVRYNKKNPEDNFVPTNVYIYFVVIGAIFILISVGLFNGTIKRIKERKL